MAVLLYVLISLSTLFCEQRNWQDVSANLKGFEISNKEAVTLSEQEAIQKEPKSTVAEAALIHSNKGFSPSKIFLKLNQKTKLYITGVTGAETSFIIDELDIYKGISSGGVKELEITPKKQGAYRFYCPITKQQGWIVVK